MELARGRRVVGGTDCARRILKLKSEKPSAIVGGFSVGYWKQDGQTSRSRFRAWRSKRDSPISDYRLTVRLSALCHSTRLNQPRARPPRARPLGLGLVGRARTEKERPPLFLVFGGYAP